VTKARSNADIINIPNAKGDLLAATAADALSRLAIGSNNQELIADSTASTGVKWAGSSGTGYVVFGNGIIIQWGTTGAVGANANQTTSFPIAFNSTPTVSVTARTTAGFASGANVLDESTTNFKWNHQAAATINANYIAIGV
jgi:hypothetical protein